MLEEAFDVTRRSEHNQGEAAQAALNQAWDLLIAAGVFDPRTRFTGTSIIPPLIYLKGVNYKLNLIHNFAKAINESRSEVKDPNKLSAQLGRQVSERFGKHLEPTLPLIDLTFPVYISRSFGENGEIKRQIAALGLLRKSIDMGLHSISRGGLKTVEQVRLSTPEFMAGFRNIRLNSAEFFYEVFYKPSAEQITRDGYQGDDDSHAQPEI